MGELPALETVRERAATARSDPGAVNLFVAAPAGEPLLGVERTPHDGKAAYVGETPAAAGLLAAAATVAADSERLRLHPPEPELTADGPWLVLEPLGGALGTVTLGRATVRVTVARGGDTTYGRLSADREGIAEVLAAARPSHDHYPVERDEQEVFTRGMTTFELSDVTVGTEVVLSLTASTTPATTPSEIRARFDREAVTDVAVDQLAGASRADPDDALREALERAHVATMGDYRYEWLPASSALARLPTANKLALGTGQPGEPFSVDAYEACRDVLEHTAEALEGAT